MQAALCSNSKDPVDLLRVRYALLRNLENDVDDNIKCDICQDEESTEDDEIYLCDLCNTAVHRSCYSRDLKTGKPPNFWFCMRCKHLIEKNLAAKIVKCVFCNDLTGVIVPLYSLALREMKWVHLTCVNWIQEIWFECDKEQQAWSNGT